MSLHVPAPTRTTTHDLSLCSTPIKTTTNDWERSTKHPKFDPTGVRTHDLQIMTAHFMSLRSKTIVFYDQQHFALICLMINNNNNNNNNNFILSPKNPINSSVDFTSKEVYYYHSISHYQIGITFTMKDKYIIKNKE